MTVVVEGGTLTGIAELRARLRGAALMDGDSGYDARRAVWNARFDRRPAVIVIPQDTGDVAEAVRFARARDLAVSVKGGGTDPTPPTAAGAADEPAATPVETFEVVETDAGTTVSLVDNRFMPKEITVKAGTPLTFVNDGANWHSVAGASGLIDVDQLASGASYTVTIDTPGEYSLI